MATSFFYINNVLTVLVGGLPKTVTKEHTNFEKIKDELRKPECDEDRLSTLISGKIPALPPAPVQNEDDNGVVINNGVVYYKGDQVPACIGDKLISLVNTGLPDEGMRKFIGRLYNNPSYNSRNQLISFIDKNGLTIDSDGYIVAYKAVTVDYKDKWTGKIDNNVGNTIKMDRAKVCDDPNQGCAPGLHCGGLSYVSWYGQDNDRMIIILVDPENVVSVPKESSCRKMRVCEYKVIGNYEGALNELVYDSNKNTDDWYDEQEEDDSWDEEDDSWDEEDWEGFADLDEDDMYDEDDVDVIYG